MSRAPVSAAADSRPAIAGRSSATTARAGSRAWLRWGLGAGVLLLVIVVASVTTGGWKYHRAFETATFKVVATYPHDPGAFTQGLVVDGDELLEGTGLNGASSLRRVKLKTGEVVQSVELNKQYFGEGITVWDDLIYQVTWKNQVGVIYDRSTLQVLKTFTYSGEGWGLTHDGTSLILSDGSSTLRFLDPKTFQVVRRISVRGPRGAVNKLNELEYVDGEIWANIWHADRIARIDPEKGRLLGWIDLSDLWPRRDRPDAQAVLNGIAYDPTDKRLFVTGKLWPRLYEIEIVPGG